MPHDEFASKFHQYGQGIRDSRHGRSKKSVEIMLPVDCDVVRTVVAKFQYTYYNNMAQVLHKLKRLIGESWPASL